MKRFELIFVLIQLPVDYAMLVLAGFTAYALRFTEFVQSIRPVIFNLAWQEYWPTVLVAALGWLIIMALSGLYNINPNRKLAIELNRVFFACSTGFAAITIFVFFTLNKFDSRFLVLASWFFAVIYVCLGRIIVKLIKFYCYRRGIGLRKTVLIGRLSAVEQLKKILADRPGLGYQLLGVYENFNQSTAAAILKTVPDEIIFADPQVNDEATLQAIRFAHEHHIIFKYSADLFATISTNLSVSTIAGVPIIELCQTRLTGWGRIFKRIMDISLSLIFIILLTPIYLIISIIILLETGRSIFYKNKRVGQAGKTFFALKFRSMYKQDCTGEQFGARNEQALLKEAELIREQSIKNGPVYKIKNDPRVTPFGRLIRKWSLDELPQFFNVLKGEMSLVGPRPHQPREVDKYQPSQRMLLTIKPGITGLAQISGRSDLSFNEEARLDTFYIEHWSLLMDFIILIKTPFIILSKKGAL